MMTTVPDHLHYTKDHEWVLISESTATVGVTYHAQEELTDVVYVELPDLDREVDAEEAVAVVESVKAASDIFSPLSGVVIAVNEGLNEEPGRVNQSPYEEGWIFKVKISDSEELASLLSAQEYRALIGQ